MPHVGGAVSDINMLSVRRRTGDVEGEEIRSVVKYYHSPQEGDLDAAEAGGEGGSRRAQRAPVGACQWGGGATGGSSGRPRFASGNSPDEHRDQVKNT